MNSLTLQQRLQPFVFDCQIINDASEILIFTVVILLWSEELLTVSGYGVLGKESLLFREEEGRFSCYGSATVYG